MKARMRWMLLVGACVVAGALAAMAMAWPESQPRQPQPQQQQQPAEELPVGGPSQAGLYFPE